MGRMLTLSIADRIAELPHLAAAVDEFLERARVGREAIDTVQLALDELIANQILWGQDRGEHPIQVQTAVEPTRVRVTIESEGQPFDPTSLPPPDVLRRPEDRREGGLGVYLVQTLVDELSYAHRDGRNLLEFKVAKRQIRLCPPETVLLLVDVVRDYTLASGERLLPYARAMAQQTAVLKERAARAQVPVVYLNQSTNRWKPSFSRQVHACLTGDDRGAAIVRRLEPAPDDIFMLRDGSESLPESLQRLWSKLRTKALIVAGLADSICALIATNDTFFAHELELLAPCDCLATDGPRSRKQVIEQIGAYVQADFRPSTRLAFQGEV